MSDTFSNPNAKGANSGMGTGGNDFKNPNCKGSGAGIKGTDSGFSPSGYGSGTMAFKGSAKTPPPSPNTQRPRS